MSVERETRGGIDLGFWRRPEGVSVPDDELRFLLLPDAVVAAACFQLAKQVHVYQAAHAGRAQITRALMVTMGGLLPGVILYDHLLEGRRAGLPGIRFGTVGLSLYKGPGQRLDAPRIEHGISIPIAGRTVLVIDDIGDGGGTMRFLTRHIRDSGAHAVLNLALYMKPEAKRNGGAHFYFGETPQDTWIITPRERVETLIKRVPVWKARGASRIECRRRLVDLIGYAEDQVDYYLPGAYTSPAPPQG